MYSLDLGRHGELPGGLGRRQQPVAGVVVRRVEIAFSSSRSGDSEIWVADASGGNLHRITCLRHRYFAGLESATNTQIAFVSGRTGEPQIYIMDQDGSNMQRMTDSGYAVSPSWAPNGGLLTFSWNRKYGPGDPGGQDIYVFEIASMHWLQVTHESGSNDFPSWAPDGRHIVFRTHDRRPHADLDDAGRRHASAATDAHRQQLHAQLELEVMQGLSASGAPIRAPIPDAMNYDFESLTKFCGSSMLEGKFLQFTILEGVVH